MLKICQGKQDSRITNEFLQVPLFSSKISLTLYIPRISTSPHCISQCIPAFQAGRSRESKKMAWAMEKSGRRPWQKAMWAGK